VAIQQFVSGDLLTAQRDDPRDRKRDNRETQYGNDAWSHGTVSVSRTVY
jgi:hypothetical protein